MTRLALASVAAWLLLGASAQAQIAKVHYGSRSTEVLTVFTQAGEGHRTIVLVHGGGWCEQKLETELTPEAEALQKKLTATVVDVDYPQCGELESAFPVEPEAIARAIDWTVAHGHAYGGDAARVSVVGLSAGSNVSTLAAQRLDAMHPGIVKAVVSDSGPMNLWRILQEGTTFAAKVAKALDCAPAGCEKRAEEWSPRFHIDRATCPPELFGTYLEDKVPRSQSEEMTKAMRAAGCAAQLAVVPRAGHDPGFAEIGAYPFLESWGG